MKRDDELRKLARQLPDRTPAALTLRRLQTRVLRDVAMGVPARAWNAQRWALVAIVGALGVAAWLLVAPRLASRSTVATNAAVMKTPRSEAPLEPRFEAFAGSVEPSSPAHWAETRVGGIERVVLDDGAIRVHVRRQDSGERFLVVLPDGEIEVRGTTFDVSVERGATTRVHVDEGVVELRIQGRGVTRLATDETWTAPVPPAILVAREPARLVRAPLAPALPAASPAPTSTDDHDTAYAEAIELLREERCDKAASAFHALALAEPGSPQAEDASFLEAVALARAGRTDAAALAAEHHLASFPRSFHRKEAAILVARAASRRGECDKARAILGPWIDDSSERNVHSALGPCERMPPAHPRNNGW